MTTNKQTSFVDEYFICGFNATRAAIRAGYSIKTARSQGQRLLTNVDILAEIEARLAKKKLSANMVLARISEMAMSNIADFADVKNASDLKRYRHKTHVIKKFKRKITRDSKTGTEYEELELELYGADVALYNLGKHHKVFTDSIRIDDWRTELLTLLREGKITKEEVLNELTPNLARELFDSIGLSAIEVREAEVDSAKQASE